MIDNDDLRRDIIKKALGSDEGLGTLSLAMREPIGISVEYRSLLRNVLECVEVLSDSLPIEHTEQCIRNGSRMLSFSNDIPSLRTLENLAIPMVEFEISRNIPDVSDDDDCYMHLDYANVNIADHITMEEDELLSAIVKLVPKKKVGIDEIDGYKTILTSNRIPEVCEALTEEKPFSDIVQFIMSGLICKTEDVSVFKSNLPSTLLFKHPWELGRVYTFGNPQVIVSRIDDGFSIDVKHQLCIAIEKDAEIGILE